MHLHLPLESEERWAHPGSFLQWNGGRSTVNGGHLLAFNLLRLHRVDLPLCAGGRRLYQAGVHDPTKTRTRPTWHYRRWRLSSLSPSFILHAIVLKGYLMSCPRMLLEEVTAQQLLSHDFIVARLCGSFSRFQNDYITFLTEWKKIKRLQSVDRPIVRSKTFL